MFVGVFVAWGLSEGDRAVSVAKRRDDRVAMTWLQFVATALVIVMAARLAHYSDVLGEKTGLREVSVGSLFIAITTSLPEIVVSVVVGWD